MTVEEIIASGLLESYVLGTTTDEENIRVLALCKEHPGLVREIEAIENDLVNLSAKSHQLNPELKKKIASQLQFNAVTMLTIDKNKSQANIYKFAMAASLLLFVTSLIYNVLLQQRLNRANSELAELSQARSVMAENMKVQEASLKTMSNQFHLVADPGMRTVALKGMNSLTDHSAMIHWNTKTDEVYFDASQLPSSPASRQYQLWAIVDGKPVDAGMITIENSPEVFQKMKAIKGAQAFAVTIEKMGGSATPTMETMCLLGNV